MHNFKTTLLFSFFIFILSRTMAQTPVTDSLQKQLQLHTQEDTVRVDLINALAKEYNRTKPKLADSLVNVSFELSNRLKYEKGKGVALIIRARIYHFELNLTQATKTMDSARQILEKVGDKPALIFLYKENATLHMDEGDYSISLDEFLKSLKLAQQLEDVKEQIAINSNIGYLYNIIGDFEKAIPYQNEALKKAESINYILGISTSYNAIGKTYKTKGNYPESLEAYAKGLALDETLKDSLAISIDHSNIGDVYERMKDYKNAFAHLKPTYEYAKAAKIATLVPFDEWALGKTFTHSGNADSGFYYATHAYHLSQQLGWRLYLKEITFLIAESAAKLNKWDTAYKYLALSSAYKDSLTGVEIVRKTAMLQAGFELDKKQAEIALLTKDKQLQLAENQRERIFLFASLGGVLSLIVFAVVLFKNNKQKQAANVLLHQQKEEIDTKAAELALQKDNLEQSYNNVALLGEIGRKITSSLSSETIIGTVYDNVNALMDAAVFGIGIYHNETKQIEFPATYENGVALPAYSNSIEEGNRFAVLCFVENKEIVIGDLQLEYKNYLQKVPTPLHGDQPLSLIYLPLNVKDRRLGVITVQSFNKNAFTAYHLFMLRTIAIYAAIALENADSYKKLNKTVDSLKTTQSQLIQSAKMASLGELTAGIAHEIQNPLNFVNNFSEINAELIEELKGERQKDSVARNQQLEEELFQSIRENSEKINQHGKRADAIVKGMLQHSRVSSGIMESTDINALCDEYLRLSYHGLRAKDKSFNATMQTDFDTSIGNINIISQDIGRVLLNLYNNAFYAVTPKSSKEGSKEQHKDYKPTVTVSTQLINTPLGGKAVSIKVSDNGGGIPQNIIDKIFQPFFTTKPTGEGTGLGLSLSYDIVKAHGGEMKVESKEGEGSAFTITLPAKL